MVLTSTSIDPSGRILPSLQTPSPLLTASAGTASSQVAANDPASDVTFPGDVVQVSLGGRNVQQQQQSAAQTDAALSSGAVQTSIATQTQDIARVREAMADLQKKTTSVTFDLSEEHNRVIVKIVNTSTGEVVRQLPPEELLKLADRMDALRGLLFKKTS